MINFIVVDDEEYVRNYIKNDIDSVMMSKNINYRINIFSKYNDEFWQEAKSNKGYNIYFLDVFVGPISGIDVAKKIRRFDLKSSISIMSKFVEQAQEVAQYVSFITLFINKGNSVHKKIRDVIETSIDMFGKQDSIEFEQENTSYFFKLDDVLYIEKEKNSKYCIIHTIYCTVKWRISLSDIAQKLNGDFVQTHKSCVINKKRAVVISVSNKIILFDNGEQINLISDIYTKEKEQPVLSA